MSSEDKKQKKTQAQKLTEKAAKLNLKGYEKHIFICTGDSCCSEKAGMQSWKKLKTLCKDLNLTNGPVYRSKASCLRVCQDGPVGVVYPDGVWYKNLDETNIEKVVKEHLIGGKPVDELVIEKNPNFSSR